MLDCRACSAYCSATLAKRNGAGPLAFVPNRPTNLQQTIQEGNVVGPLLKRRLKQGQSPVDTRGILPIVFVFGRRLFYIVSQDAKVSFSNNNNSNNSNQRNTRGEQRIRCFLPLPSWFLHCRGSGESRPELSGE